MVCAATGSLLRGFTCTLTFLELGSLYARTSCSGHAVLLTLSSYSKLGTGAALPPGWQLLKPRDKSCALRGRGRPARGRAGPDTRLYPCQATTQNWEPAQLRRPPGSCSNPEKSSASEEEVGLRSAKPEPRLTVLLMPDALHQLLIMRNRHAPAPSSSVDRQMKTVSRKLHPLVLSGRTGRPSSSAKITLH